MIRAEPKTVIAGRSIRCDGEEALEELLADALGVADEVAVKALEQASVFHHSRCCGTCVPHMPRASSTASPT